MPALRAQSLSFRLASFALLVATIGCGGGRSTALGQGPRGVVVISVDTLRADHLGVYGYGRDTSPFLDRLAREGVLFEHAASSAPWTLPSHASLLTGVYPSTHRGVEGSEGITPSVKMAAELYQEAGWSTAGFVASWFVSHRYGFQRGFDRFEDFERTVNNNTRDKIDGRQVVDAAVAWLEKNSAGRFFLFVHLYDVHFNYAPPPEHAALFDTGYRGPRPRYKTYSHYLDHPLSADVLAHEVAMYDGEIHYVDSQIERLHRALAELGVGDKTLLLVTADHGEEFFERGSWGHAHTLYEELTRVPLILHGPGLPAGRRVTRPVRQVDVLPTLLEASGLAVPAGLHGASLLSLARGDASTPDAPRPAFLETSRFGSNVIGWRRDAWKVILDLKKNKREIFDLEADPGETTDLAASRPERLASLEAELLAAAGALVPDRWLMRWFARGHAPLAGTLTTSGYFFISRASGAGSRADVAKAGDRLSFELGPGGVLEIGVLPVDAEVRFEQPPTSAGEAVVVAVGADARTADLPLSVSSHAALLLSGVPTPPAPALALWLEQSRAGGGTVHLTDEDKHRLESLGYAF